MPTKDEIIDQLERNRIVQRHRFLATMYVTLRYRISLLMEYGETSFPECYYKRIKKIKWLKRKDSLLSIISRDLEDVRFSRKTFVIKTKHKG